MGSGLALFPTAPRMSELNHSDNVLNGTLWDAGRSGQFWTPSDDESKCLYCHGDTKHSAEAAGYINSFKGTNTIGGGLTGDWCAACHRRASSNYNSMLSTLSKIPPEITGDPVYGNYPAGSEDGTSYYDHSTLGSFNDTDCKVCHNSAVTFITEFMHGVKIGQAGGPDCISCHNLSGTAPKLVDVTILQSSAHNNLNGASTGINKACYACHGDGSAPSSGHPANYKNPMACADCHTGTGSYSAPPVVEHNQVGQDVTTLSANCNS